MAVDIDSLRIRVQGMAQGATKSINTLIKNLDRLQLSLEKLDASKLNVFSVNATKASNGSKKLATSLDVLNASSGRSTKSFYSLAAAFGSFYANFFLVVRGMKALWGSIEKTADYVEAFNYYTVAFGKIASKWDEQWENYGDENARNYSNAFVKEINESFKKLSGVSFEPKTGLLSTTGLKNLGANLQEVTQYAAQLASMMDAVGQSGETTLATTNAFVKLAGDISSLYNIDYSSAASSLRSVLQGQSRAGYKFGWDTTLAALQATADKLDLSKPVSEMTQMEKQQLRILTILEQSRVAWGDQANTISTLANQMRILKNNMSEAGMMLGQLFVPLMQKLVPIINGVTIALKDMLSTIAISFGVKIEDIGQGFADMSEDSEDLSETFDELTESSKKLKSQLQGFDKLNVLKTDKSAIGGDTIDLTQQIIDATTEYEKVWNEAYTKMENRAEEWAEKIKKPFEIVKNLVENMAIGDWISVGEDVSKLAQELTDFITKALESVDWVKVGKSMAEFAKGIDWGSIFKGVGESIASFLTSAMKYALGYFFGSGPLLSPREFASKFGVLGGLKYLYELIKGFTANFWQSIGTALSPIGTWIKTNVLIPVGNLFSSLVQIASSAFNAVVIVIKTTLLSLGNLDFKNIIRNIENAFAPLVTNIKEKVIVPFVKAWEEAIESISTLFNSLGTVITGAITIAINGIIGILEGGINGIIGVLNGFIKGYNETIGKAAGIFNSDWETIGLIKEVNFKRIPQYKTGGFPEDGLFFANHNELVGQFNNGKTAVANNEQIVAGIERGVRDANSEQNTILREQNALLRQILAKDMGISSRDIFNATRTEANNYTRRTGQPAFI
jgi:hypothetical protein